MTNSENNPAVALTLCDKCGQHKPACDFYFNSNGKKEGPCAICRAKRQAAHRRRINGTPIKANYDRWKKKFFI